MAVKVIKATRPLPVGGIEQAEEEKIPVCAY